MPGPLKFYKTDPMFPKKNRGSGYYYHRARGYYAKYSGRLDKLKVNGPFWNNSKNLRDPYRHTHDYRSFKIAKDYPTNYRTYKHVRTPKVEKRFIKSQELYRSWLKKEREKKKLKK